MQNNNALSMRTQIRQSSATLTQTGIPTRLIRQQDDLLNKQNNLIKDLVAMETHLKSLESGRPDGMSKPEYYTGLDNTREAVVDIQMQLDEARAQLEAIQSQGVHVQVTTAPPPELIFGHTESEIVIAGGFLLLFPLIVAFAIRIMKRGSATTQAPIPADRFARLETAMESIAVEVERLGESQRFTSKLLNEAQPKQQAVTVKPNYDRLMQTPV